MIPTRPTLLCAFALAAAAALGPGACGQPAAGPADTAVHAPASHGASPVALGDAGSDPTDDAASTDASRATANGEEPTVPAERFSDGARNFDAVRSALLRTYYDRGLGEDELYRAATQGMLELLEPRLRRWNRLLGPAELAALRTDLRGEIVGVGLRLRFDPASGYADVLGTLPGSPAEHAGLAPPDKIVTVDGRFYGGRTFEEMVRDIRGRAGERVTLTVLHLDRLITVPLERQAVSVEAVSHLALGEVGYVRVRAFHNRTVPALRAALEDLAAHGARALVLDLRTNAGGALDDAVGAAGEFLPAGTAVATLRRRDRAEPLVSRGAPLLASAPLAVLVDHETASGAELLAAALRANRHATIVGQRTFGKWTVQTVEELPNGFAAKFTIGVFAAPDGQSYDRVGLAPDLDVASESAELERITAMTDPTARLAADAPLRTAVALLRAASGPAAAGPTASTAAPPR